MNSSAHWRDAAVLVAFGGTEPIWRIALGQDSVLSPSRRAAREALDSNATDSFADSLLADGCAPLHDFVRDWLATDHASPRPSDETLGVLFQMVPRMPKMTEFFAEELGIENLCLSLCAQRDTTADQKILQAVDVFEVGIVRGTGADAWEKRFMGSRTLNPFVDLTYPLYRGYCARSQWFSAKTLFSATLDVSAMRAMLGRFQKLFGPLENPRIWEDLAA